MFGLFKKKTEDYKAYSFERETKTKTSLMNWFKEYAKKSDAIIFIKIKNEYEIVSVAYEENNQFTTNMAEKTEAYLDKWAKSKKLMLRLNYEIKYATGTERKFYFVDIEETYKERKDLHYTVVPKCYVEFVELRNYDDAKNVNSFFGSDDVRYQKAVEFAKSKGWVEPATD